MQPWTCSWSTHKRLIGTNNCAYLNYDTFFNFHTFDLTWGFGWLFWVLFPWIKDGLQGSNSYDLIKLLLGFESDCIQIYWVNQYQTPFFEQIVKNVKECPSWHYTTNGGRMTVCFNDITYYNIRKLYLYCSIGVSTHLGYSIVCLVGQIKKGSILLQIICIQLKNIHKYINFRLFKLYA